MKILYHQNFRKHFRKRVIPNKKLEAKFYQRLSLLLRDPNHPLLKRHQLKGKRRSYWSFSIAGDIRVVYRIEKNKLLLYDVGTHAQVY